MQQYTDALEFYMDIIAPHNVDKSFVVPAWAVVFAEQYAEHRASPPPSSNQGEDQFKVYDLSDLTEEDKQKFATDVMRSANEALMMTFYSLGLKSHLDQRSSNESTGDEFILMFRKTENSQVLGPPVPFLPAPPTNQGDFSHLGPEAEGIINAVYEGAELWKQEYDDCRRLLQELVTLKKIKDTDGKTDFYLKRQPELWAAAELFLSTYQHNIS